MRSFTIHEVMALSGMSRGQVDQFISRYGFGCYGQTPRGLARQFHPADVFNFTAAGELHRLGISMPMIRDMLVTHIGNYRWDAEQDQPAEMYPGQGAMEAVTQDHFLVYFPVNGDVQCVLLTSPIERLASAEFAGVVVRASAIAARILAVANGASA